MAQDRYQYFRVEAAEILDQLGQGALDLEKGVSPSDTVPRLLRLAHTLKGAARVVQQREIADRAHALEDALAAVQGGPAPIAHDRIDRVFSLLDEIGGHLALLAPPRAATRPRIAPADESAVAVRPAMDDLEGLLGAAVEAHLELGALRLPAAQMERARRLATLVVDHLGRARDAEALRPGSPFGGDKLRALATDLRGMLDDVERNLTSGIDRVNRSLRQVGEAAERLRLAPAGALFTFLERAVRDVAQSLGKRVVFEASGGDVRVDTVVLGVVQGALLQVARNAVAHGIEPEEAGRTAAGKPAEGRVTLRVVQRGAQISFACTDDGRGVDLEAVRRIARQKGLASDPAEATEPEALLRLLMKGGISTSGTVTDVSGRGIGLDVVREAAARLGGEVGVRTETGRGTTIEIRVPLSVASLHALLVEAAGAAMAIPLEAVAGCRSIAREDIKQTERGSSVLFEGREIPLGPLPHGLTAGQAFGAARARSSAVVVRAAAGPAAFTVDRIIGPRQIIMRPLPELAPLSSLVAGAALDAVGDPLVVFDPDTLVAVAHQAAPGIVEPVLRRPCVLVIDDSLTTRMLEQSILESAGYEVEVAASGEEALDKARTGRFSLFLVDVEMPGMDGFTFVERVRADPALRHIPSILVTSRSSAEDRRRGESVGAQAYIVKSEFDQRALLDRIRALVG